MLATGPWMMLRLPVPMLLIVSVLGSRQGKAKPMRQFRKVGEHRLGPA